jgi:catechol 2,3-dioxygenase-like lactoylglutathione lyase family enzyme
MFERVTLTVSDLAASERFYRTVLGAIGRDDWGDFELREGPAVTRGLHLGFAAPSRADVDAFWRAGVEAGYPDDGEPGPRPQYSPTYYGGFLLDPDGNSAEAVHRAGMRTDGTVDHLWLRVSDLTESAAFYGGLEGVLQGHVVFGERVHFEGGAHGGTFGVVTDGRPLTENLSMAFAGAEARSLRDPDGNRVDIVVR